MKLILIGSKNSGEKNDIAALKQHFNEVNTSLEIINVFWEDLIFHISLNKLSVTDLASGMDLSMADQILSVNWYRGGKQSMYKEAALTLALYLQAKNVPFWNEEMLLQRSTSKLSAMMQLALLGLDVPTTLYSISGSNLKDLQSLKFPIIVKAAQASRGRDNYLVKDAAQLTELLDTDKKPNPYLIQEYIENEGDLRIVCADKKPVLVIKRTAQSPDTHLNNVSQGGQAHLVDINDLDTGIIQACGAICSAMGRNIAGIDLLLASNTDRRVFLEVNAIPQLTSGAFVKEKTEAILTALMDNLERNK